jgi:hypothetical protein
MTRDIESNERLDLKSWVVQKVAGGEEKLVQQYESSIN